MIIVPGRATSDGLLWWVLSDVGRIALPDVNVIGAAHSPAILNLDDAQFPHDIYLIAITGLAPDQKYRLQVQLAGKTVQCDSRTLPDKLNPISPFTIAFGSCYCKATDRGIINGLYPPKTNRNDVDPIRIRFLLGDQIYMDLDPNSGAFLNQPSPDAFARYLDQWNDPGFLQFLQATPNLMMADDHEFWNDYPHANFWQHWSYTGSLGELGRSLDKAFALFQASLNVNPASVVNGTMSVEKLVQQKAARTGLVEGLPFPVYMLDTRTRRTRFDDEPSYFVDRNQMAKMKQELDQLDSPAIILLSQPFIEKPNSDVLTQLHWQADVNLPDYHGNYLQLMGTLDYKHDLLVLTGDIHYSRLARAQMAGVHNRAVYEAVSSPFAHIPTGSGGTGESSGKLSGYQMDWNILRDANNNLCATHHRNAFGTLSILPGQSQGDLAITVRSYSNLSVNIDHINYEKQIHLRRNSNG